MISLPDLGCPSEMKSSSNATPQGFACNCDGCVDSREWFEICSSGSTCLLWSCKCTIRDSDRQADKRLEMEPKAGVSHVSDKDRHYNPTHVLVHV